MASSSETTLQMSPIGSVQMKLPVPINSQKYFPKESDYEMVNIPEETHEVVIAIEDTDASTYTVLSAPPKVDKSKIMDFHKPLNRSPLSPLPKAIITDMPRPKTPSRQIPPPPPRSPPASPRSTRSSPTLVRSGSIASTATHSPVMRSMFPRYDPSVPLTHQKYYPNPESRPNMPNRTRHAEESSSYSPSLYSQMGNMSPPFVNHDMGTPRTLAGSRPSSPFQAPEPSTHPSKLSTPEELLDLWSIANGQGSSEALATYTLSLICSSLTPNHETLTLSSPSHPLYTLSACSYLLTVTRTHPLTATQPTIPICVPSLSTPTATSPSIANIFPKLAELMALDQSSSIAVAHKLSRRESDELQAEALARAWETEASSLLCDTDSGAYCLSHPSLSPQQSEATLPIVITPSTISILAPNDQQGQQLLTLSFPTRTLTIHTAPLAALPSLYILDTLLSVLLTLLLHLHREGGEALDMGTGEGNLMQTPFFAPPPTERSHPSLRLKGSKFESKNGTKSRTLSTFLSRSNTTKTTDLSTSMDLNKPSSSESDPNAISFIPLIHPHAPNLTSTQKNILATLYWGFGLLIWIQGVFVNLFAAAVVGIGKKWDSEARTQRHAIEPV